MAPMREGREGINEGGGEREMAPMRERGRERERAPMIERGHQ